MNIERMRNFMTLFRIDESFSDRYKLMEPTLIKIAEGENQGSLKEKIYAMEPMERVLMNNFMATREQMLLLSKTNMTVDGKATISTRNTGREIQIGEGLIPQIERYCSKHVTSKMTINTLMTIINEMSKLSDNPQGNHLTTLCFIA